MSKAKLTEENRKRFEMLGLYLRELRCLTQEEVAKELNIDRTTLINIEGGKTNYGIQNLLMLADYFEISMSELMRNMD